MERSGMRGQHERLIPDYAYAPSGLLAEQIPDFARAQSGLRIRATCSLRRLAELARKGFQIAKVHIRDRPIGRAIRRPCQHIVTLHGASRWRIRIATAAWHGCEADDVLPDLVDERRNAGTLSHIDATAKELKAVLLEVDNLWRLRDTAGEPGLDGVTIG